jgi:hypothetical protein
MPLLPLWAFLVCSRVNVAFTFTLTDLVYNIRQYLTLINTDSQQAEPPLEIPNRPMWARNNMRLLSDEMQVYVTHGRQGRN